MPLPDEFALSPAAALLLFYAWHVPYHRGKQRVMQRLTSAFGVSIAGETIERRDGLWWSLDPADYVCQDLLWCGRKDVAIALKQRCTIHAFEPTVSALERLHTNLTMNDVRCVHGHRVGVWDRAGSASLVHSAGNSGATRLTPGDGVSVIAVDEFCRDQGVDRPI